MTCGCIQRSSGTRRQFLSEGVYLAHLATHPAHKAQRADFAKGRDGYGRIDYRRVVQVVA